MKLIIGYMTVPDAQFMIMQKLDEMSASLDILAKSIKALHDLVIAQRIEDDGK